MIVGENLTFFYLFLNSGLCFRYVKTYIHQTNTKEIKKSGFLFILLIDYPLSSFLSSFLSPFLPFFLLFISSSLFVSFLGNQSINQSITHTQNARVEIFEKLVSWFVNTREGKREDKVGLDE